MTISLVDICFAFFNKCLASYFSRYINTNAQAACSGASFTRPRGIPFPAPLLRHCQSAGPFELYLCAFLSSSATGLVTRATRDPHSNDCSSSLPLKTHEARGNLPAPTHACNRFTTQGTSGCSLILLQSAAMAGWTLSAPKQRPLGVIRKAAQAQPRPKPSPRPGDSDRGFCSS